jgi:hypothetical protein
MANEVATIETRATQLAEKIEVLVTEARQKVASVANTAQVYTYYEIGRYIVEDEQGGKVRAEYGKGVLKRVSERLTERLGKGWSEENLRLMRKFYTLYSYEQSPINKIQTNGLEIQSPKIQTTGSEIKSENSNHRLRNHQFVLPWAHYLILTHVKDSDALVELTLPKTPISMHSNMHSACLTKPCFSKNCVNGLRNIERRMKNE